MSTKKKWVVWHDSDLNLDLETGSHAKCLKYYKKHGGEKAGLHIGYIVWEKTKQPQLPKVETK